MFTKNENKIKLNFNGEEVAVDALIIAFGINKTVYDIKEFEMSHKGFNEAYVSGVMEIIDSTLSSVLGDDYDRCISAAFPKKEVGYFDMIDLFSYIKSEFDAFENNKKMRT